MKSEQQDSKILKFRKSKRLNIGIITFGIIFIYLVATIIMYITAPRITAYEVRQGSILKDHSYTALALRDELVVTSNDSGYINYCIEESRKVKVGNPVYTISTQEIHFDNNVSEENSTLSDHQYDNLSGIIQNFNDYFTSNDFSSVYSFKNEMMNSIADYTSQSRLEQLQNNSSAFMKYSNKDGVIVFSTDGLESLTKESVKKAQLSKENYSKVEFTNNTPIQKGDPIYKLVLSDKWNILFEISDEMAEELAEKSVIKVKFKKDNQIIRAGFEIIPKDGVKVVVVNMNNSMIRYCDDRYLDIELILEDETGLKIPKTAEATKDFYVVPSSYLTQGGDSNDDGVLVQKTNKDGDKNIQFKNITVYYQEDDMIYLDPNVFEEGDALLKPDSADINDLSEIRSLKGVYSINKGYAVFKQIHILCESDDYYIIEEGNDFGLSNYDHIALHSDQVKENDIVF